jgi:hypothetical protein
MAMKKPARRSASFVVCVRNDGYPESLELRKLYRVVPDPLAGRIERIRVIDESGEDYLYPASFFVPLKLEAGVKRALAATG